MVPRAGEQTLELSFPEMRNLVEQVLQRILLHLESLPQQPAVDLEGAEEVARSVMEPLPEQGQPLDQLLEILFDRCIPKSFNTAGPGYLAYIPGGGLFQAAVADLIAASTNRYMGVWQAAPALAQIETCVLRWFCQIVGYPPEALGVLTTGGSLANWMAVVVARNHLLPEDFLSGTVYTSDQAHHSVSRAVRLAGFPRAHLRWIPSDDRFRVDLVRLERAIEEDRKAGKRPFLLVGQAGTTNTGAVDDLAALARLAREQGLWLHVDAAYGGFFLLTQEGRVRLAGIEQADSLVLDPHKGLFLPYGTGCLLVRDRRHLKEAFSEPASYLPRLQQDPDFVDFCEISPELSRDFRGLRVWLPFKLHGVEPFRRNLEEKLELARWAAQELENMQGVELVAPPQLSLLAFRLHPAGWSQSRLNELNRRFLEEINRPARVYLTGTQVGERFLLRLCILSFRTHRDRVQQAMEDIRLAARRLL